MKNKGMKWYAVYTGFRKEKSAQRELERAGIEAYVPTVSKVKRYTSKVKKYQVPLISHYVFVRIEEEQYKRVLSVRDVLRFIGVGRKRSPIPEEEIQILKHITGEIEKVEMLPLEALPRGSWVEVMGGALTGLKGKVLSSVGKHRLLVELNHIGFALSIEVPTKYLRAVNCA